jgi:hypothetical protein
MPLKTNSVTNISFSDSDRELFQTFLGELKWTVSRDLGLLVRISLVHEVLASNGFGEENKT